MKTQNIPKDFSKTALYTAENFTAFWQGVIRSWLKNVSQTCWKEKKPSVILAPSSAWAHFIKAKMAEENLGAVGLQFWFPSDLRKFLRKKITPELLLGDQPAFHFLLSVAAASSASPALQKSVAADPSSLWREIERGMESKNFDDAIIKKFIELKNKANFQTTREMDAAIFERISKNDLQIQSLLVVGFDSQHWPLWNLLRAAVLSSEQASLCLLFPQKYTESLDMTWIGSWEQFSGEAQPLASDESQENRDFNFHVGADISQQAQAVALQTVKFLQENPQRIGILVPEDGALAREIGVLLDQANIEFYDGIGYRAPALDDQDAWNAWMEWQTNPNLLSLFKLIRLFHRSSEIFELDVESIEKIFRNILAETLTDDIAVARAYSSQSSSQNERLLAEKLEFWSILPEQTSLEEYISQTIKFFRYLHWESRAKFIEALREMYPNLMQIVCSREIFLKWIENLSQKNDKTRSENGSHSFSRVQMLTYAEAEGQEWSHLILTGLNEGLCPRPIEVSGWISEEEIAAHNRRAIQQGSQGEGHFIIREGKEICMGPVELRFIQQRQFQFFTESATRGMAFTWSLADENRQILSPSDFLTKFYRKQKSLPLDEALIRNMAEKTSSWIASSKIPRPPWPKRSGMQTAKAYAARRDLKSPFGIYDFSLASPPEEQICLACKKFEDVLRDPAKVWMEIFLGVKPPQDWELPDFWNMTRGTWAHDWLRRALNPDEKRNPVAREKISLLRENLQQASLQKRMDMEKIFNAAGAPLPAEWIAAWSEAFWCASHLLESVGKIENWLYALTEWKLPHEFSIPLEKNLSLLLKGCMDLILFDQKPSSENIFSNPAWVMDYKTGSASQKFDEKKIYEGQGLQLILYALSLEALGAHPVSFSMIVPEEEIFETTKEKLLSSYANFWKGLAQIEKTGVFGARGDFNPEFGFKTKYPIATLPPEKDLLEERWQLTHPLLKKS